MNNTVQHLTGAITSLRRSTLSTLGLGSPLDIFRRGRRPVTAEEAVSAVFGPPEERGSLVISGASGIVGAGKTMQLGSRLEPFGVRVVALDMPGAPDGIGRQYPGLVRAFGRQGADRVMSNITRLTYDGKSLPPQLADFDPRFLLEAIPEILPVKRAHYEAFRAEYPDIEIRSVTSGFPARELGVGVAHPAFPHEINKMWETVEAEPSHIPQLLWALGLVPVPVADHWSFVLDVIFCGVTQAAIRYHRASNMPYWKIDKWVRKILGPNPFRAHDAIGAQGANFLTWSCLHHLGEQYGALFEPTPELIERKDSGQTWYPPNHFRPLVDWELSEEEEAELREWLVGPMVQMASLLLQEERAHPSIANAIGESCAQLRRGVLALARGLGVEGSRTAVAAYHRRHPEAAQGAWFPEALESLNEVDLQQLYVNAEHDGRVGSITLSREAYNWEVDAELNRAIDWLRSESIERVLVSGDFHLATQLVGADTAEFFPALDDEEEGYRVSLAWSKTARRLHDEFSTSVAFLDGKRCLGGMLELILHCHFVVAESSVGLGFPEVTLPVVPGMEGCHLPFRRSAREHWPKIAELLLGGQSVQAKAAQGWVIDYAGPLDEALRVAWALAGGDTDAGETAAGVERRPQVDGPLDGIAALLNEATTRDLGAGGVAIRNTILAATAVSLAESLELQSRHSAKFMLSSACRQGVVGQARDRVERV
jgi:enoyl-CoA hydratase/carnithine racemase/3-hydroxyacyl-CoA dehydrogenase